MHKSQLKTIFLATDYILDVSPLSKTLLQFMEYRTIRIVCLLRHIYFQSKGVCSLTMFSWLSLIFFERRTSVNLVKENISFSFLY